MAFCVCCVDACNGGQRTALLTLDLGREGDTCGTFQSRQGRSFDLASKKEATRKEQQKEQRALTLPEHFESSDVWGLWVLERCGSLLTMVRKKWTTAFSPPRLRGEVTDAFWGAGERAPRKEPWEKKERSSRPYSPRPWNVDGWSEGCWDDAQDLAATLSPSNRCQVSHSASELPKGHLTTPHEWTLEMLCHSTWFKYH